MNDFLLYIVPFVAAAISTFAFEKVQRAFLALEDLPAGVKRALSAAISYGLNLAGVKLGVAIGMIDPLLLTQEQLTALVSGGLAIIFHSQDRARGALRP